MSIIAAFEETLKNVKTSVDGDIKDVVGYLEAAFQHLHAAHVEDIVKDAIATELHAATIRLDNIAKSVQSDLAETAVEAITKAVRKKTSQS